MGKAYTVHFSVSLDATEYGVKNHPEIWLDAIRRAENKPTLTEADVIEGINYLRSKGYSYFPACDKIKPSGACQGHEKPTTAKEDRDASKGIEKLLE